MLKQVTSYPRFPSKNCHMKKVTVRELINPPTYMLSAPLLVTQKTTHQLIMKKKVELMRTSKLKRALIISTVNCSHSNSPPCPGTCSFHEGFTFYSLTQNSNKLNTLQVNTKFFPLSKELKIYVRYLHSVMAITTQSTRTTNKLLVSQSVIHPAIHPASPLTTNTNNCK